MIKVYICHIMAKRDGDICMSNKIVYDKEKVYDIMDTTQCNYANMLKRLSRRKTFSNFVITYYSVALIIYSLTAEFFPEYFDVKLSSYFNIILSIVVLTYSLIITNANYADRIHSAEKVLNEVKAKKRELTEENVNEKRNEYDRIISKAEYRTDIDFFRTLKQRCKKNNVCWLKYKKDLEVLSQNNSKEAEKLNGYLSENFPLVQQIVIILQSIWSGVIVLTPVVLFVICFLVKTGDFLCKCI